LGGDGETARNAGGWGKKKNIGNLGGSESQVSGEESPHHITDSFASGSKKGTKNKKKTETTKAPRG